MVTHSFTGQTASHTPHPQQAFMFASYKPSGVTSKQEAGHCSQHKVHLMHVSKFTTGRMVLVLNFKNVGLRWGWQCLRPFHATWADRICKALQDCPGPASP